MKTRTAIWMGLILGALLPGPRVEATAVEVTDGTRLLSDSADSTAIVWDAASGQILQFFSQSGPIWPVAFVMGA
jgi:WD40 repeat protein